MSSISRKVSWEFCREVVRAPLILGRMRISPIEYRSVTSRKCCSQNISILALDPEKAL